MRLSKNRNNHGHDGVQALTPERYARALRSLARRDRDLGRILDRFGPPPMWSRRPGFPTLIHIILEQQVSLASAKAAFDRLRAAVPRLTPAHFLKLDARQLKRIGFSRQKTRYGRELARTILDGRLRLGELAGLPDDDVRAELLEITGIGSWTVDIYLLMALRRPDIWPRGDLALVVAAGEVKRMRSRPSAEKFERLGDAWKPWRAVAARLLWHHYLSTPRR
ncbi:MAG: DNA-3-methyladenine glycosylase 2 family protein [Acidobacteriota bacterium]|nr:DNA-3-methyladenine glycosylase 2 family protein [Acidobacteriota bacterium]